MRPWSTTSGAHCLACGGRLEPWLVLPAADPSLPGQYALVRCTECGTARTVAPAPADVHAGGAYRPGAPRGARAAAPVLARFDAARLRRLRAAGIEPPARVLDAGAGRGRFVAAARAAGYEATGIDPRAEGPHVERTLLEAAPDRRVDAITVWHVLEHLDDPSAALARLSGWLEPGGVLLAATPNHDSLQRRIGGGGWYHWDVPRHRTHFTPHGLRALLERHGLNVERTSHLLLEHNPFGLWQSAVSRVTPTPSWLYHALKRNARATPRDLLPTLAALPLVPIAAAVELAAGAARRGGTVVVTARKRG